jgi:hypothetical protein
MPGYCKRRNCVAAEHKALAFMNDQGEVACATSSKSLQELRGLGFCSHCHSLRWFLQSDTTDCDQRSSCAVWKSWRDGTIGAERLSLFDAVL